jgi:hypothetical protein
METYAYGAVFTFSRMMMRGRCFLTHSIIYQEKRRECSFSIRHYLSVLIGEKGKRQTPRKVSPDSPLSVMPFFALLR